MNQQWLSDDDYPVKYKPKHRPTRLALGWRRRRVSDLRAKLCRNDPDLERRLCDLEKHEDTGQPD